MSEKNGYRLWSGEKGTKVLRVGADDSVYCYTDIQSAIDAAQNNDIIRIEPATYTLTTALSITKPLTLIGEGGPDGVNITSGNALGTALAIINVPVSYASDVVVNFENIAFNGADADKDVVQVDNGAGANQTLKVRFHNCTLSLGAAAHTGYALNVAHTYASKGIEVKISGKGWHKVSPVYFLVKNTADSCNFYNMRMVKSDTQKCFTSSADDVAAAICLMQDCTMSKTNGTAGGHANQALASCSSRSFNGGCEFLAAATTEFTGSHLEYIVN